MRCGIGLDNDDDITKTCLYGFISATPLRRCKEDKRYNTRALYTSRSRNRSCTQFATLAAQARVCVPTQKDFVWLANGSYLITVGFPPSATNHHSVRICYAICPPVCLRCSFAHSSVRPSVRPFIRSVALIRNIKARTYVALNKLLVTCGFGCESVFSATLPESTCFAFLRLLPCVLPSCVGQLRRYLWHVALLCCLLPSGCVAITSIIVVVVIIIAHSNSTF